MKKPPVKSDIPKWLIEKVAKTKPQACAVALPPAPVAEKTTVDATTQTIDWIKNTEVKTENDSVYLIDNIKKEVINPPWNIGAEEERKFLKDGFSVVRIRNGVKTTMRRIADNRIQTKVEKMQHGIQRTITEPLDKSAEDQTTVIENIQTNDFGDRISNLIFTGLVPNNEMANVMQMFAKGGYAARAYPMIGAKGYFVRVYKTSHALQHFEAGQKFENIGLHRVFIDLKNDFEGPRYVTEIVEPEHDT